MKILVLGSVALPVPPPRQGGTEWMAYYQAEGLAGLGHEVILVGAKGSQAGRYQLVEIGGGDTVEGSKIKNTDQKLKREEYTESSRNYRKENVYLSQVIQYLIDNQEKYDFILNNMRGEAVFLPSASALGKPLINVMHLPLFSELASIFRQYKTPLITVSNAQRKDFPDLNYLATVYNCVDTDKFSFNGNPSDYLLMMASISPHKNQAAAIRIAKKLGMKLILAGKINSEKYFEEIKKDIDGQKVSLVGELAFEEKLEVYQNARAFIFPVVWQEPFGLVMIEAMSCGTPVVAFANGAIPEVLVNGKTGFVIENHSEADMIEATKKIDKIKREDCRKHVLDNFSVEKMVAGYESALTKLL